MRRKLVMLAIAMTLPAVLRPPKPVLAATAEIASAATVQRAELATMPTLSLNVLPR